MCYRRGSFAVDILIWPTPEVFLIRGVPSFEVGQSGPTVLIREVISFK